MQTRTALVTFTSLIAVGLSGCAISGTAEPEDTTEQTPSTAPAEDALTVDQPKDLTAVSDPCQLLTPEQLAELGATDPKPDSSAWEQAACRWSNQQLAVKVSPDTKQGGGMVRVSEQLGSAGGPVTDINGHPALHYGTNDIRCGTYVGANGNDILSVSFSAGSEGRTNPEYQDPCAMSDRIAGMVLENLPPA